MPDMEGKTAVVTGGSSGIGFETAIALASMGARVLITARNADKARAAVASMSQRLQGKGQVQLVVFDLGDLASVRRGAAEILEQTPRLDVLVNNAGLVLSERSETVDGYEATFAINHLGPFLLTNLLLDRMTESTPSRIVNVSSTAHNTARKGIPFDDLQSTHGYRGMRVYGQSKLANILFTRVLAKRLQGTTVTATCFHPGFVRTSFGRGFDANPIAKHVFRWASRFARTPEKGAETLVYLATSADVAGASGGYYFDCKLATPSVAAQDDAAAERLWQLSEQLVGEP